MNDVDFDQWMHSDFGCEPESEQSLAEALRYNLEVFENGYQIGRRDLRSVRLELRGSVFVCKRRLDQPGDDLATWDVWLGDDFFGTFRVAIEDCDVD